MQISHTQANRYFETTPSKSTLSMKNDVQELLKKYPKERPKLPAEYQEVYVDEYRYNRESKAGTINSIKIWLEGWMHRKIAQVPKSGALLEVGAGTLNHLAYEGEQSRYDVVEPFEELFEGFEHELAKVGTVYASTTEVPLSPPYNHIISIATFEHMVNLPAEMEAISDRLSDDGLVQVGIPSEGGLLWFMSWKFVTGLSFRLRRGLSYATIMNHEHVNNCDEILQLAHHYFSDVKVKRFPLPHKHLSFYTYFEAKKKR